MGSHNGISWFKKSINKENNVILFTDASDTAASGIIGNKWTVLTFDKKNSWMAKMPIAWRELLAVILAISTFGPIIRYADILMNIDNKAIQQCITNGKSKDPQIMALIRVLYFYCAIYNVNYTI